MVRKRAVNDVTETLAFKIVFRPYNLPEQSRCSQKQSSTSCIRFGTCRPRREQAAYPAAGQSLPLLIAHCCCCITYTWLSFDIKSARHHLISKLLGKMDLHAEHASARGLSIFLCTTSMTQIILCPLLEDYCAGKHTCMSHLLPSFPCAVHMRRSTPRACLTLSLQMASMLPTSFPCQLEAAPAASSPSLQIAPAARAARLRPGTPQLAIRSMCRSGPRQQRSPVLPLQRPALPRRRPDRVLMACDIIS